MNDFQKFEKIVAQARREQPPVVDVSEAVLRRIDQPRPVTIQRDPLVWFTGFSITTAAVIMLFAYQTWETVQEPLMVLVEPFRGVLP